jgi:hypothetical protein
VPEIDVERRDLKFLHCLDLLDVEPVLLSRRIGSVERTGRVGEDNLLSIAKSSSASNLTLLSRRSDNHLLAKGCLAHFSRNSIKLPINFSAVVSFTLGTSSGFSNLALLPPLGRPVISSPVPSPASDPPVLPPVLPGIDPARPRTPSNARGSMMGRDCGRDESGVPPGAEEGGRPKWDGEDMVGLRSGRVGGGMMMARRCRRIIAVQVEDASKASPRRVATLLE